MSLRSSPKIMKKSPITEESSEIGDAVSFNEHMDTYVSSPSTLHPARCSEVESDCSLRLAERKEGSRFGEVKLAGAGLLHGWPGATSASRHGKIRHTGGQTLKLLARIGLYQQPGSG
jgi:hypothetical protein